MEEPKSAEDYDSKIMKYNIRAGTINNGKNFEFKMTALLSLRCVIKNQGEMWVASNAPDVGAFDDVVLRRGKSTFLLQLKHKENPSDVGKQDFLSVTGDFALPKYVKDIDILKKRLSEDARPPGFANYLGGFQNLYFVIITNRKVSKNCEFLKPANNSDLSFLKTKTQATKTYKIDVSKLSGYVTATNSSDYDNFYLLANQVSAQSVDTLIVAEVKKICNHLNLSEIELKEISEKFTQHITDWAEGNLGLGYHYCLPEVEIMQKLTQLLLSKYEVSLSGKPFSSHICKRKLLWKRFTEDKTVTVVNASGPVLDFLVSWIGTEVSKFCIPEENATWTCSLPRQAMDVLCQEHPFLKLSLLKLVKNAGKVTPADVYRCLCMVGELPFLLKIANTESCQKILQILKLSHYYYKVVIIKENHDFTSLDFNPNKTLNHFFTMQDLTGEEQHELLKLTVNLQGRSNAVLGDVIDENMYQYLSCSDIIDILLTRFNIGNQATALIDHFVKRKFSRVLLKSTVLNIVNHEVFLIEVDPNSQSDMLSIPNSNVIKLENANCTESEVIALKQQSQLGFEERTLHWVTAHDRSHLEWKASFGPLKNIRYFHCNTDNDLEENILNRLSSKVTILSAWPGMGKSVSMDYVVHNAPTDMWVLKIDLNAHQKYYRSDKGRNSTTRADEHLKYFNDFLLEQQTNNIDLANSVFQKFASTKKVVVLLDGFDEVSISYKSEVMNIAQSLHREGYRLWITTRPHLKTQLEEAFDTFSVSLQQFTVEDQKQFLVKYFSSCGVQENSKCDHLISEFVEKLLHAAKKHFNDADAKFTGVPLQTKLLAEVFQDRFQAFVSGEGKENFIGDFDLVYLYKNFISRKIDILCEKFGESSRDMVVMFKEHQQLFALKLLFPLNDEIIAHADRQLEYYTNHTHKIELLQKTGIVIVDEKLNVAFAHRTFAEYSVAKWLAKNIASQDNNIRKISQILSKERFSGNYRFLFNLFDRIVTRDCRLHNAVMNKRLEDVQDIINSNNDITETDRIGRSVLHTIALYGTQYPILFDKVRQSFTCYEGILFVRSEVFNSDVILKILEELPKDQFIDTPDASGYHPLDYALANFSLTVADKLREELESSIISADISLKLKGDYLGYCALLNYTSLFYILLVYFASKDLLLNNIQSEDLVESYMANSLASLFSISEKDRPLRCRLEVTENTMLELLRSPYGNAYTGYVRDSYYSDLRYATIFGSKANINQLLSKGSDVNKSYADGNALLHYAVLHGKSETIDLLLYRGADINKQNLEENTPLHLAVTSRNLIVVAKLLEWGADINAQDFDKNAPVHLALLNSDIPMLTLLLSNDPDVDMENCNGENALHVATYMGCHEIVDKIISKGASADRKNNDGETPIFQAVRTNNLSIMKLFADAGANVNIQNNAGETILHIAAYRGYDAMIKEIVSKGADIDKRDKSGNTSLFYAVEENRISTLKLLVLCGADVNVQFNNGQTVLHLAIFWEYYDAVREIISTGHADVNKMDFNGETPIIAAVVKNNPEIIKLLLSSDADKSTKLPLTGYCIGPELRT